MKKGSMAQPVSTTSTAAVLDICRIHSVLLANVTLMTPCAHSEQNRYYKVRPQWRHISSIPCKAVNCTQTLGSIVSKQPYFQSLAGNVIILKQEFDECKPGRNISSKGTSGIHSGIHSGITQELVIQVRDS
jgi:hypothetical protein